MRVLKFLPLAALLGMCACQSARRPAALLSSQQGAPSAVARAGQPAPEEQKPPAPKQVPEPVVAAAPVSADPVADLIAKVEKEYQAGQQNYTAGHLEAARQNFDRAFDLLLGSNLEIHSDPRLEAEFDRILDGVNGSEMQALQQGDGFTEQKPEPAPIDEANEVNVPVDARVKAQAEAEIKSTPSDLPLMMTDQVAGYISYFSGHGRGVLENALTRSGRYEDMIRRVLKEEGVPQDLIYLAQAESGFHPLALSRVGARGIWQFMASRALGYGLKRDWWVDDRQDPEKSTRAAARHLKDLYAQFGDWYLAMAAYNSGPGTVQSAVKRTGYADFWELYRRNVLPRETRNYVPIILAVTIMAKNPAQYGLDHLEKAQPVPFDTVRIDYPVDLRLAAECVDVSASDLQDLNPSLLRMTTPNDKEFDLRLPAGTKDKFQTAIAAIPPGMRVWWRYHKVKPGDTLASIAREYRTTAREIAQANDLEDGQSLPPDSKLTIPIAPGKRALSEEATYSRRAIRYKVHKGDTVQKVADNFGVPPAMVRRWNHLKGDSLRGRSVVYVHLPVTPSANQEVASSQHPTAKHKKTVSTRAQSDSVVHHKVKQGETLYSIASAYKTTVEALKRDNRNIAVLHPGMVLVIRP
jgi:membrane-bound lytic murein transglycosylase D